MQTLLKIDLVHFAVFALAVWRIASLLANESGPFDLLMRLRLRVGVRLDNAGKYGANTFAKGLICVWCSSVWYAVLITIGALVAPDATFILCLPLALSAVAVLVEETLNKLAGL